MPKAGDRSCEFKGRKAKGLRTRLRRSRTSIIRPFELRWANPPGGLMSLFIDSRAYDRMLPGSRRRFLLERNEHN